MDGESDTDRGGHRFFDEVDFAGAGVFGGFAHGAAFDFRDARGDGDEDAWVRAAAFVHLADEVAEHCFGDFKVGDDAVLEWADRDDVAGRAAEHAFGIVADGEDFVGTGLHGDDRRFAQDDAVVLHIDECVGGAEVDADVTGEQAGKKFLEHGCRMKGGWDARGVRAENRAGGGGCV